MKKKYKLVLSKEVDETIDDLLKKGDKKGFMEVTEAIAKIKEDPYSGNRMYYEADKQVLEKINSYKGKKVKDVETWDVSGNMDYDFIIEDILVGSVETKADGTPARIIKKMPEVYLDSVCYKKGYVLCFSSKGEKFKVYSKGICVEKVE
jgi:hypothetical protein